MCLRSGRCDVLWWSSWSRGRGGPAPGVRHSRFAEAIALLCKNWWTRLGRNEHCRCVSLCATPRSAKNLTYCCYCSSRTLKRLCWCQFLHDWIEPLISLTPAKLKLLKRQSENPRATMLLMPNVTRKVLNYICNWVFFFFEGLTCLGCFKKQERKSGEGLSFPEHNKHLFSSQEIRSFT